MMRTIRNAVAGVVAGCALVAAGVQALAQGTAPPLRAGEVRQGAEAARVDDYLSRLVAHGFSGAVLIAAVPKGGNWATESKVVLKRAYGLANRDTRLPYTVDMVSCIGSVTKQFTGAAIMKLEMMGKLKTGDLISMYLPGVPADKAGITIHHLLTHTAGFSGDLGGSDEMPIERDALVAKGARGTTGGQARRTVRVLQRRFRPRRRHHRTRIRPGLRGVPAGASLPARGGTVISHNGGNGFFFTDFRRYVDEGVVIIAMSNQPVIPATQLAPRQLEALYFNDAPVVMPPVAVEVPRAQRDALAWTYPTGTAGQLVVRSTESGLEVESDDPTLLGTLGPMTPPGGYNYRLPHLVRLRFGADGGVTIDFVER